MTVQFNIEYKAMFGEQIVVNIQTEEDLSLIHILMFMLLDAFTVCGVIPR